MLDNLETQCWICPICSDDHGYPNDERPFEKCEPRDLYNKIIKTREENTALKEKLKMAKEALEYYANYDNWYLLENTSSIITDMDLCKAPKLRAVFKGHLCGGKHAREALKAIGEV